MKPNEADLINAMVGKGHTESTARGAIAGRGFDELAREYLGARPGGAGVSGNSGDVLSQARQLLQFQTEANQPAIQSLQGQMGELGNVYAGQRTRLEAGVEPLRERYNQILDEMKGNVSRDLSREYGRRGIPLSSGMFEQDLTGKINPLIRDVGLAREEGVRGIQDLIAGLVDKETLAKRDVLNAIAQLQAGQPGQAITGALSMAEQQRARDAAAAEEAWRNKVFESVTLPESQAGIANIQSQIANRGSEGGGVDLASLLGMFGFGGGAGQPAKPDLNRPVLYDPATGNMFQYDFSRGTDPDYLADIKKGYKLAPGYE